MAEFTKDSQDYDGLQVQEKGCGMMEIEDRKKNLLKLQWESWIALNARQKQSSGLSIEPNFFNKALPYYMNYVEFQIDKFWEIFEELNNLTARLGDYQIEDFEG